MNMTAYDKALQVIKESYAGGTYTVEQRTVARVVLQLKNHARQLKALETQAAVAWAHELVDLMERMGGGL